ncbi:MAG: DDE-type integrase/transposase/recombinase [Gemmatimonadetes bacterium]|nr:DDE-type integrase/transposase/recombinase [Gemmatimonadota bacterium]
MSGACLIATHKRYGFQRVCRMWRVPRSSLYAQRQTAATRAVGCPTKPGPMGPCSDPVLVDHIRRVLAASPFHGEGDRKVGARLRLQGLRTSKERVRRLMRQHGLQAPQRREPPPDRGGHDGTIITEQPDRMWGTDATTTMTRQEGPAYVFVSVDHCTFECIGLHAAAHGHRFEALEPIRQGVRQHMGGYAAKQAAGLTGRHDHGSVYLSDDFQKELDFLGIESSPSFVRQPQGNGCVERFIGLLKENLLWVHTFATVEELRRALIEFKQRYNQQWLLQRHNYKTPAQVRHEKRRAQYEEEAG